MFGIGTYLLASDSPSKREFYSKGDNFLPRYLEPTEFIDTPSFVIDLDAKPEHRWNGVVDYFFEQNAIPQFRKAVDLALAKELGYFWPTWVTVVRNAIRLSGQFSSGGIYHWCIEELLGMAKRLTKKSGIAFDFAELYIFGTLRSYLTNTTTVVSNQEGHFVQVRQNDWSSPDMTRFLFNVKYCRESIIVFRTCSFLGAVGCDFGMRLGRTQVTRHYFDGAAIRFSDQLIQQVKMVNVEYSVSMSCCSNTHVDERTPVSSYWQKLRMILTSSAVPPQILLRFVLEECKNYEAAVLFFKQDLRNSVYDDVYITINSNYIGQLLFLPAFSSAISIKSLFIQKTGEKTPTERCLTDSYAEFCQPAPALSLYLSDTCVVGSRCPYSGSTKLVVYNPHRLSLVDPDAEKETQRLTEIADAAVFFSRSTSTLFIEKFVLRYPMQSNNNKLHTVYSSTFSEAMLCFRLSDE